ncbi:hypothetical protein [Actinoplanes regularis]|uniref:Uncharacterized protein n=1 Tax=Actinoplanes regularis TaxID=52697 RepID=A0A238XKI6_9ACTN|nr:hypothetical protein [Actinoplanes regularis]GIE90523.1 hypothetical protein Are01nite_70030 [Actinoplanes regularis]SNR59088.1 hypothetical protein SAMN06264365_103515 [Actinoplanes regularis]
MPRLAHATLQRLAEYGSFFLHDPDVLGEDPDDSTALAASRKTMIAATTHRAYLQTTQRAVSVHITLEVWDTEPAAATDWDERHEVTLTCPTGRLLIENTGDGPIPLDPHGQRELTLPPGTTRINLRAYARGNDTRAEVERITMQHSTASFDEFRAHLRTLDGRERYLLQAWPAELY